MLPIAKLFLVNEGIFDWARASISHILGKRQLNKVVKSQLTSDEKIENSERIQKRLTPKPSPKGAIKMGFKGIRSFKHPADLP